MSPPNSVEVDRVLIVGGGLAALRTAAELRERGFSGHITVAADEPHAPYDRPPLSKELFTRDAPSPLEDQGLGEIDNLADRLLQPARVIDLRASDDGVLATVVGIAVGERLDPEQHRIMRERAEPLVGATTVSADLAVLATGSEPFVPRGLENSLTLRTWQDARNLRAALHRLEDPALAAHPSMGGGRRLPAELAIIGAGWIGAEVSSAAAAAGIDVTVFEAGGAPLWRELGHEFGLRTEPWYAEAGVDLRLHSPVRSIEGSTIRLEDTSSMNCDAILVATGSRPRTDLLGDVVRRDRTGAVLVRPDGTPLRGPASVRVVGDAATIVLADGTLVPGGHWDGALHHPGLVAAGIICDSHFGVEADELGNVPAPSTFSTQFGHEMLTVGELSHPRVAFDRILRVDEDGWTGLAVDLEGRLHGGVLVDHPRDAMALRKALANGRRPRVDVARLADVSVPLRKILRG